MIHDEPELGTRIFKLDMALCERLTKLERRVAALERRVRRARCSSRTKSVRTRTPRRSGA